VISQPHVLTFIIHSLFSLTPFSFYHLHSTVIGNTTYPTLNAVYSFYNVATSMPLKVRQIYMLGHLPVPFASSRLP